MSSVTPDTVTQLPTAICFLVTDQMLRKPRHTGISTICYPVTRVTLKKGGVPMPRNLGSKKANPVSRIGLSVIPMNLDTRQSVSNLMGGP